MQKLIQIQKELKAPKNQRNNFWNYNYRSCEDILEAVKPLLWDSTLTLSDDVVEVGGKCYIKATATLTCWDQSISTTAFAREADTKKGMDEAQITWSASSYARKYALNWLFCIDDTKDTDTTDNPEDWKNKIDRIRTVEELRQFASKNKGKGKDFDNYILSHANKLKWSTTASNEQQND